MSYITSGLQRVTSSANENAQVIWAYKNADDAIATIIASGYFNDAIIGLTTGVGKFSIGDVMFLQGSDSAELVRITAVTTNVTVEHYITVTLDTENINTTGSLTIGDVLTFSDGATIDNTDATTLTITETNIALVGALAVDALTLSDVLTFSDGATIDNTAADTLTITEDNIDLVGALAADAVTLSDVLTFSDGATIDNTDATTLTITEDTIDLVGALVADGVTLSGNLNMPSGGVIDFNSSDVTITHSTAIGGLLTYAGGHVRYADAMQVQFREATQYLRSDSSGSLIVSAQTALHLAIAGVNQIDISSTTMAMNGNTISECGHIYFNSSAAMLQDAADNLTVYGGNTTGDYLLLQGSSADASAKLKIIGNGRSEFTGALACFGTLNVGGLLTLDGGANVANGDVTLAEAHYLNFVSTAHSIRKVGGALNITGTEIVLNSSGAYINGGFLRMVSTAPIYFDGTSAYIHSTATGKIAAYCSSTAADAFKIGTGAGGGIQFETFLRLHVTDGEGAVEGQIWFDDSENVLKFYDGSQVRTVTSS